MVDWCPLKCGLNTASTGVQQMKVSLLTLFFKYINNRLRTTTYFDYHLQMQNINKKNYYYYYYNGSNNKNDE